MESIFLKGRLENIGIALHKKISKNRARVNKKWGEDLIWAGKKVSDFAVKHFF
jgi:hypothetical protein